MFQQRTSSKKPSDELLANFRKQFPYVARAVSEVFVQSIAPAIAAADKPIINPPSYGQGSLVAGNSFRGQGPLTPGCRKPFIFTPLLLDPNSYACDALLNKQQGVYIPTPGGNYMQFHSLAGNLHTSTLTVGGVGTPLQMPISKESFHSNASIQDAPGDTLTPNSIVHQNTACETKEQDERMLENATPEHGADLMAPSALQPTAPCCMEMNHALAPNGFRFHSTLIAPTAMIRHVDEVPITYLNKGQMYSLSIADTDGSLPIQSGTKYRTYVRISFDDDEQGQRPSAYWRLWKEASGSDGAHRRSGNIQAVEYVAAEQYGDTDERRPCIDLERSSFDGFCVTWLPPTKGSSEVNLAVRFNFLSTDFSRSKGVKAMSARLCAKTQLVCTNGSPKDFDANPEVSFCKVKVFRDHGAERKSSNDIVHVKKSIDKLNQKQAQIESGRIGIGKRKRVNNATDRDASKRPDKAKKHKITSSMSSTISAEGCGGRMTREESLQIELQTLHDMLTSTSPVSVLYLRGGDLEDPDFHPVSLLSEKSCPKESNVGFEGTSWKTQCTSFSITGSMNLPSPSSLSHGPQESDTLGGWIEAPQVNTSYGPTPEQVEKSVACFYMQYHDRLQQEKPSYYRAIYLARRTLEEFNGQVATTWGIEPAKIMRSIHPIQGGLEIEMDDDDVRELREGQDMRLEIEEVIEKPTKMNNEPEMSVANDVVPTTRGFVLRIIF